MDDNRGGGIGESTLTIKWWGVLIILFGLFGWMFISILAQETRITKIETHFSHISQTLEQVNSLTKEIREYQLRRFEKELKIIER
jgi:hypothetical protein